MDSNGYRLLLPEGTLDYFDLVDVQETSIEVVIYLEEENVVPEQYSSLETESKGFYDPVVVHDFPLRDKKLFLNIRRRRWILKNLKSATKLFSVLLASKRPLITELADKLRLKYPLLPTISPCPTMRLEAIRSIIPISCRRYPKSV